jgi:hypothetical protein
MRRITRASVRRRCLAAACLLSALVGVAAGALWVCTYRVGRGVAFSNYPNGLPAEVPPQAWGEVASRRGALTFVCIVTDYPGDFPRGPMRWRPFRLDGVGRSGSFAGELDPGPADFALQSDRVLRRYAERTTMVLVPHWAVLAATSALPAWSIVSTRRRRLALEQGRCPRCGYDLRATPERCPECGAD